MGRRFPVTLTGTMTADEFLRVTDQGDIAKGAVLIEGFLYASTNGLVWRIGDQTRPGSSDAGDTVASGAARGFGPAPSAGSGWPLDPFWIRNETAGANTSWRLQGIVEVEQ